MPVKFYADPISGNCDKVKWTLDHLGIAYEWIETSVVKGDTRTPAFRAVNPVGQVPTVVLEDGRMLTQSNALILYFAEGSSLIPADAYERAKMLEWMFWEQYNHEPYIAVARFQLAFNGKTREELGERLFERGNMALQRMEDALAGGGFLVGDTLTLADIALAAYTRLAHEGGGFDLALYPAVRAWTSRVEAGLGIV